MSIGAPVAVTATEAGPAVSPWPRPTLAWGVVLLLSITYCLSFIDRYMLTLMVEPIKADLGLSDTQIGLISGVAFGLFFAIAGLPMGALADRTSRRGIIAAGVFVWSAMTTLSGFAANFVTLFICRMGLGLGEAALLPAGVSLISDYFPPARRGRAVSIFMMGASIGSGLAIMVGGVVVGLTRGVSSTILPIVGEVRAWQLAFLVVGIPGMIFALVFLLVREPVRRGLHGGALVPNTVSGPKLGVFMRANAGLLALQFGGMSACSICAYGFTTWTPTFLIRVFGWTPEQVGLAYGPVVLVASASGMLTGGILSDRRVRKGDPAGPLRVAAWGLVLLAIATPISTQIGDAYATLAMLGVVTFAIAVPYGVSMTALMSVTPNALRGTLSAIYMFCISVAGFGIGPTFVGYLSDRFFRDGEGLRNAISVLGLATAPFACLALFLAIRRYRAALAAYDLAPADG